MHCFVFLSYILGRGLLMLLCPDMDFSGGQERVESMCSQCDFEVCVCECEKEKYIGLFSVSVEATRCMVNYKTNGQNYAFYFNLNRLFLWVLKVEINTGCHAYYWWRAVSTLIFVSCIFQSKLLYFICSMIHINNG